MSCERLARVGLAQIPSRLRLSVRGPLSEFVAAKKLEAAWRCRIGARHQPGPLEVGRKSSWALGRLAPSQPLSGLIVIPVGRVRARPASLALVNRLGLRVLGDGEERWRLLVLVPSSLLRSPAPKPSAQPGVLKPWRQSCSRRESTGFDQSRHCSLPGSELWRSPCCRRQGRGWCLEGYIRAIV